MVHWAVGLFNRTKTASSVTLKWPDIGCRGKQIVRDLWRQKNLGVFEGEFNATVASHGVVLVRIIPAK